MSLKQKILKLLEVEFLFFKQFQEKCSLKVFSNFREDV